MTFGRLCRVTQQLGSGYVTQNPLGTKSASSHCWSTALPAGAQLVLTLTHPDPYSGALLHLPFCSHQDSSELGQGFYLSAPPGIIDPDKSELWSCLKTIDGRYFCPTLPCCPWLVIHFPPLCSCSASALWNSFHLQPLQLTASSCLDRS